jgi:MoaA/NifB/PqqE/SkfB family radical SAM enzyme
MVKSMSWFRTNDIERLQIEITNYCNAACKLCERDQFKNSDSGYTENWDKSVNNNNMTLKQIKKRFHGHWPNLRIIHMCGNIDEPTINPEIIDIIKHLHTLNDNVFVAISTNGGARNAKFWTELGELSKLTNDRVSVIFGIDGLEYTNHLYRANVKWHLLERNWRAYIEAGGYAVWQFIPFPWNAHQIEDAKKWSVIEGFSKFVILETIRGDDPLHLEGEGIPDDYSTINTD